MKRKSLSILTICTCLALIFACSSLFPGEAQSASAGNKTATVRDPMWGVELQFEGYQDWTDHPLYGKPNFVFAGKSEVQSCSLLMSMFAEVTYAQTAGECRKKYMGNPAALKDKSGITLIEERETPVTYTLYDHSFGPSRNSVQNQLYGYWVRNQICFELHVSSIGCPGFRSLAMPILQSVRLSPDNGATHETVAIARKGGLDPGDWKTYMLVGGLYLHGKPRVLDRARRFYAIALMKAGSGIDPKSEWYIQEGIGLAWLLENNPAMALHPLLRAKDITEKGYREPKARSETLYNIACTHALLGQREAACSALAESMSGMGAEWKAQQLERIKEDNQLTSLRGSSCYRTLTETPDGP